MASPISDRASALAIAVPVADAATREHDARRVSRTARLGLPLNGEPLVLARQLIADKGLTEAARLLGTSRNTLAAAAGGAGLREGTRLLFEQRLRALDNATPPRRAK